MQEETAREREQTKQREQLEELKDNLHRMLRRTTPRRKTAQQLKRRREVMSMLDQISRLAA